MHRRIGHHDGWNARRHSAQDLIKDVLFGSLQRDQRLGARVIDTTDQWELGSIVLEYDGWPGHRRTLAHRLGDFEHRRNGAIHFDKFAGLL